MTCGYIAIKKSQWWAVELDQFYCSQDKNNCIEIPETTALLKACHLNHYI